MGGVARAFAADTAGIAPQPYFASVGRTLDAMAKLGAPLQSADAERIATLTQANDAAAVAEAETLLDRYTLARLEIDAAGVGSVMPGGAAPTLVEQGWRLFLVRIANPTGRNDRINFSTGPFSRTPGAHVSRRFFRVAARLPDGHAEERTAHRKDVADDADVRRYARASPRISGAPAFDIRRRVSGDPSCSAAMRASTKPSSR